MGYIRVPVETNPETLARDIFNYIQTQQPNWTPSDGNLDVWIARAIAAKAAENRTLAGDVPDDIFSSLGTKLFAIPPVDAVAATGNTTWTLIDTNGHVIPAGTFVGIRNANGDLVTFETLVDVTVAPGDSVTAAGQVLIRAVETGTFANGLSGAVSLITVLDWVNGVTLVSPTGGGVDPETNETYQDRLARRLQRLSTVPILPQDFANAAFDADPGVYRSVALDGYNPNHNLLTTNEASAETDASGWINLANATVGSSAAQASDGTKSVSLTSVAAGDMSAILNREIVVLPGATITVVANVRAATTTHTAKVGIQWRDAAHAVISTVYGAAVADVNTAFGQRIFTAVAPDNTAYAKMVLFITGTSAGGEVHYFDKMSFRHGTGTDWVIGGTPETGNIRTITIAAVNSSGNPVSSGIKTNIVNYINARREQNWVTGVMDAKYTSIDVAATVKIFPGYNATIVHDAVVTALQNYLAPNSWGQDPTIAGSDAAQTWIESPIVYYNELITLVGNVAGVDRVTDLTVNINGFAPRRTDIAIDSPAGLTTAGTITAVTT